MTPHARHNAIIASVPEPDAIRNASPRRRISRVTGNKSINGTLTPRAPWASSDQEGKKLFIGTVEPEM